MLSSGVGSQSGDGPGWWEVLLWVGLVGMFDVGIVTSMWSENSASGAFLAAVSVAAWIWVFASQRRRGGAGDHPAE